MIDCDSNVEEDRMWLGEGETIELEVAVASELPSQLLQPTVQREADAISRHASAIPYNIQISSSPCSVKPGARNVTVYQ